MNTKINLQQLARMLAQKKNLSQKDAESFLKDFFDSIVQNVTTDKLVKIKGLGTFKLVEVLDRESVNVNTGERIVIPGHSKLSFAPETALKDLINKPFADFQTTIINEGTSIEEMEWVPDEAQTLSNSPFSDALAPRRAFNARKKGEDEELVEEQPEIVETPAQKLVEEPVCLYGPPPVALDEEKPVGAPKPEPEPEEQPVLKQKATEHKKSHSIGKYLVWLFCILLLCALAVFAYRYLTQKPSVDAQEQVEPQVETPVEVEDAPAPEVQYAQVPDGKYKIVGTKKTYVMKPGDFVTRIAIQEYGDKDVAQYIIVHNNFPDPDNVPVDSEIKLPELEEIE